MSINIIYGKARTGKTTLFYNRIKEKQEFNNENNIKTFVIVPEQFGLSTEENLCTFLGKNGLLNIEVLTFKRLAYKLFNELGLNYEHISDVGKKVLIYNILNKNKYKIFKSNNKGNIENILGIFDEFERYNLDTKKAKDIEYSNAYLKNKVTDLLDIYEKYKEALDENVIDSNTDLDIVYDNIEKSNIFKNCDIYIDEFYGFTNQEYNLICKLSMNNNVNISFCIDNETLSENPLEIYNINKQAYFKFINLCKENNIEINEKICLDSNQNSSQNKEIIHLQNNIFSLPYKIYNGECNNIKIYACINQYTEIENLAQNILKNIDNGYTFSDIVVITRDIGRYSDIIWGIFNKYKIPYFLDLKKDIIDNQISSLIFSLIDIILSNFSYEAMFSYLKTGFLDIDADDIFLLENYVIKWGIKGYKWFNDFRYGFEENSDDVIQQLEKLNEIRKKIILSLNKFKNDMSSKCTVIDIVSTIYSFLNENGIEKCIENKINEFRKNGLIDLEKEYINIWNYYIESFNQLSISLNNTKIDLNEFKNILNIALSNTQKAFIPLYKDCVLIGDIERTRTKGIKIVYYIGTQNGGFPITYTNEGILTDNDREFLQVNNISLAKTTKLKTLEDQFNIYKSFTMIEDNVNFSYICNDLDGISYRPAFLINKLKKMFGIEEIVVDNEYINKFYLYNENINFKDTVNSENTNISNELLRWYLENNSIMYNKYLDIANYSNNMKVNISNDNIQTLYGNELNTSISRLEQYVRCPYSFYLKYCLKVKNRDVFAVKMIDIGNLNHKILDEFFSYILNEKIDIFKLTQNDINIIGNRIVEQEFYNINNNIIKNAKDFNILKYKLTNLLLKSMYILILQIQNSSFVPIGTEIEFGDNKQYEKISIELDNRKIVNLTGKIDRIDIADTKDGKYIRIIDYKSSSKSIDISDIYSGLNLQLITYLDATTTNTDIIPGGILYFKFDNPIISTKSDVDIEKIEQEIVKQLRLNGLILNNKTLIKHMDHNIDKTSNLVNIKVNDDGTSSNKNAVTLDDFYKLQKQSKKILKQISNEIISGKIDILPYWKNKSSYGCQYCDYNSICKFDSKNEKCKYNLI